MKSKIELLNSEGPILELYKKSTFMLRFKESGELMEINEKTLRQFLDGKLTLITEDSKGWNMNDFSDGMKQSKEKINQFINS